ncbi:MAG: hypothetical protein HKN80_12555, partial [Acidimicrobiia bacterium]|nr:hypothetical protein [Acidimicrobiia bacterium]
MAETRIQEHIVVDSNQRQFVADPDKPPKDRHAMRSAPIGVWWLLALVVLAAGCGGDDPGGTTDSRPWSEEDVAFTFGDDTLFGVLTLPASDGPHPAIVLVTGAASTTTGVRDGTASRALISFAHTMVLDGY